MEDTALLEHAEQKQATALLSDAERKYSADSYGNFYQDSVAVAKSPLLAETSSEPLQVVKLRSYSRKELMIRMLDVTGSVLLLVVTFPMILLSCVLIKLFSPGPVLYKQQRVGKSGKLFMLFKLRTMVKNAEQHTGPVWAAQDDDRVTTMGKILRCTRLDELPQLFNVIRGDMSLVGPRPERPFFVNQHRVLRGARLSVKPGVTGLAQIRGLYNLKPEHKVKYDHLYVQKRSFLFNLYILLQTIPVVLLKRGW